MGGSEPKGLFLRFDCDCESNLSLFLFVDCGFCSVDWIFVYFVRCLCVFCCLSCSILANVGVCVNFLDSSNEYLKF